MRSSFRKGQGSVSVSNRIFWYCLHRAPVRQPISIDLAHRRRDAHRPGRVYGRFTAVLEVAPTRASAEELHRLEEIRSLVLQRLPAFPIHPYALDEPLAPFIDDDDRLVVQRPLVE